MTLTELARLFTKTGTPKVATLIGGGGKTGLMRLWAQKLKKNRFSVVTAATTHFSDESLAGFKLLHIASPETAKSKLKDSLDNDNNEIITLVREHLPDTGKCSGIPAGWIDQLEADFPEVIFLVEGDGSGGRSLKGHLDHEPVIPSHTSLLIPVMGLDILEKPLNAESTHRPEVLSRLTGLNQDSPIQSTDILAVLHHPNGYLRKAPEKSLILPFLNKAESFGLQKSAHILARQILTLKHPQLHSVLIGSVRADCFVIAS